MTGLVALYDDRIPPLDRTEATHAAALRARARRSGGVLDLRDEPIPGTGDACNLAVATRTVRNF